MIENTKQTSIKTVRIVENNRLVYYREKATKEYWDQVWIDTYDPSIFEGAEAGQLSLAKMQRLFLQFLPKEGKILEAGCGRGQIALALQQHGYDIEGVEWGEQAVQWIQQNYPQLPVKVGDVTQLDVPDDYYSCYISLGVVEHRKEGPEPFLSEAYRIIKPGGTAIFTVPYFHVLRRIKGYLGLYEKQGQTLDFYQQAFRKEEFASYLTQAGFSIIAFDSTNVVKGIKDEIGLLNILLKYQLSSRITKKILRSVPLIHRNFGHMLMVICKKPDR